MEAIGIVELMRTGEGDLAGYYELRYDTKLYDLPLLADHSLVLTITIWTLGRHVTGWETTILLGQ